MKRLLATFIFISFIGVCNADDFNIIKKGIYELRLEQKIVPANSGVTEVFNIDTIGRKIPDLILSTVMMGDFWIENLPVTKTVSFSDNKVDNIVEYWDVSFVKVRNGNVIFTRTIFNFDLIERKSYAWDISLVCIYVK